MVIPLASMLEIEPEDVEDDDEIKDLLAEISNIVGGNLKSALNDAGHGRCAGRPADRQVTRKHHRREGTLIRAREVRTK